MRILSLRRVLALLLAVAIALGLIFLGAQPVAVGLIPAPWDKLAHGLVFAVLAAVLGVASGLRGGRMIVLCFTGALLVGIVDEWHQMSLPGRHAGWDDLAADALGALMGSVLLGMRKARG